MEDNLIDFTIQFLSEDGDDIFSDSYLRDCDVLLDLADKHGSQCWDSGLAGAECRDWTFTFSNDVEIVNFVKDVHNTFRGRIMLDDTEKGILINAINKEINHVRE